jgi:hypothetical protein
MNRVDPQESGVVELIARGEITRESLEFIRQQLGRQGLSTEVLIWDNGEPEAAPIPEELPYDLDEIISPEQYLVREHVTEFRQRFAQGYSENRVRLLFGILGGSSQKRYRTRPGPAPEALGLVVTNRRSVGLPRPKAPQEIDSAVQVGSLLSFAERARSNEVPYTRGFNIETKSLLFLLTERLQAQIDAASALHE